MRHEIFFSDATGVGGRRRDKKLKAFLVCSGAVFERGNWASTFDCVDVVLRCSVGLALCCPLRILFRTLDPASSREADVLDLSALISYPSAQYHTFEQADTRRHHTSCDAATVRSVFLGVSVFLLVLGCR